jgi:broad specificity phosphatase PhoE
VTTTILLARHGESDWNAERRWQGHADRPLSERGRVQAKALAQRLEHIDVDAVYSSDLERAFDTASAVAAPQGLDVVRLRDLREVDVGSWSGLTRDEAAVRFPESFERWQQGETGWDDGETYEAMSVRVVDAIRRVAGAHPGEIVVVVAHGGPIRAIHAKALGIDVHAYRRIRPVEPNARLSGVCVEDGELTEVCPGTQIDELIARDRAERLEAAAQPPTPAG